MPYYCCRLCPYAVPTTLVMTMLLTVLIHTAALYCTVLLTMYTLLHWMLMAEFLLMSAPVLPRCHAHCASLFHAQHCHK